MKSTVFGIPLPICSCGVVPVAASLKKSGASNGSIVSFMISTPQVGADSFMITYSLLGWIFALFRIVASLITALAAGIMVNILDKKSCETENIVSDDTIRPESFRERLRYIPAYVEYNLSGSLANALLAGILIAGIISYLVPDGFFEKYLGSDFLSMILMLIVGIPLYVCAAASTPVAASFVMKGISPGAALVFLLTGPATNAITILTVFKFLGRKSGIVYLSTIAVVSIVLGYVLNILTARMGFGNIIMRHSHDVLPEWLKAGGSVILALMIGWFYVKTKLLNKIRRAKVMTNSGVKLTVRGMTCMHCAGNVKKAVESVEGTSNVSVLLDEGVVTFDIKEKENIEKVKQAIELSGYTVP
jgi:hypothetical protein